MAPTDRLYMLFPYQILPDRDLRHLALFAPVTHRLQVLEPVPIPPWGPSHFETLCPELSEEAAEQLRGARAGFREFAAVHQDHCLAASYASETLLRQSWESRFDIQASLRGGDAQSPDPGNRAILEAALFLEMAAEFDLRQAELEADLTRAAHLETEFREILGIDEEGALEDTLETLSPTLAASRAHLSFMLPRRIASWLRVLSISPAAVSSLVLVTVSQEVVDEILDRVEALTRHRPSRPVASQRVLATLPGLPSLPSEDFEARLGAVGAAPEHEEYRRALESLMVAPENPERQEALGSASADLAEAMENVFGSPALASPVTQLALTVFSDLSLADLALAMDPGGSPPPARWAETPAPPILCLTELPELPLSDGD
ncbi:MAG: hypothetical protein MUF52_01745 [Syntrophobacteraceae bacterium]|jgi:hypothetical protein|nr:hypothetical protein [Syntrophobacteraceae bacterium]